MTGLFHSISISIIGVQGKLSAKVPDGGGLFSEGGFEELLDPLPSVVAVPWLGAGAAENPAGERSVVLARILHHFDLDADLAQRPIHLLALTEGVGLVGFALEEQKRSFGVADFSERALTPGIRSVLPWLAVEPSVVIRGRFGAVFAVLVDDGGTADDRLEAVGLAFDEGGHFSAVAVSHKAELAGIDRV